MKFVVIEGLDGSGKSTQVKKLLNYLETNNIKHKYLHFPRTDSPVYGELVSMFLRGDLGDLNSVNPYLVALIYAGDRDNAKAEIINWLENDYLVLVDRYVYSNIAFQCAKVLNEVEQDKLAAWILKTEYEFYKIPKPDLSIFLDVPFEFTRINLTNERQGDDRTYLEGKKDIHEDDLDFQERVKNVYLKYSQKDTSMKKIDCSNGADSILQPDEIFSKILDTLKNNNIL